MRDILVVAAILCALCDSFHLQKGRRINYRIGCHPSNEDIATSCVSSEVSSAKALSQGVVLLAQPSEYNHFLIKAAVLVYDYGSGRGSRGVILERATAYTMGETIPTSGPFEQNTLYLGGEDGSDKAIMFHKYDLEGSSKYIGSGIYTGGLAQAKAFVENNMASPKDFKFVFNSVEWGPDQLEGEVKAGRWDLAYIPPDLILQQSSSKASLWSKARNTLRSVIVHIYHITHYYHFLAERCCCYKRL